jgi:hypothetical protein
MGKYSEARQWDRGRNGRSIYRGRLRVYLGDGVGESGKNNSVLRRWIERRSTNLGCFRQGLSEHFDIWDRRRFVFGLRSEGFLLGRGKSSTSNDVSDTDFSKSELELNISCEDLGADEPRSLATCSLGSLLIVLHPTGQTGSLLYGSSFGRIYLPKHGIPVFAHITLSGDSISAGALRKGFAKAVDSSHVQMFVGSRLHIKC